MLEEELGYVLVDLALIVPERVPPPDLLAGIRLAIDAESARLPVVPRTRASLPPRAPAVPIAGAVDPTVPAV